MTTLLLACGLAVAAMNSNSNVAKSNAPVPAINVSVLVEGNLGGILNNCFDDPGSCRRQLEMRSLEFGPLANTGRTMIG